MKLVRIDRNKTSFLLLPEESELPDIVFARQRLRADMQNEALLNIPRENGRIVLFKDENDLVRQGGNLYPRSNLMIITTID